MHVIRTHDHLMLRWDMSTQLTIISNGVFLIDSLVAEKAFSVDFFSMWHSYYKLNLTTWLAVVTHIVG